MDWSTWVQTVGGNILGQAAEAQYVKPFEIQKLQLQQQNQNGQQYTEGQPAQSAPAGGLVLTPGILMLVGVVVLVVMLRD